jgi:ORF6N domain
MRGLYHRSEWQDNSDWVHIPNLHIPRAADVGRTPAAKTCLQLKESLDGFPSPATLTPMATPKPPSVSNLPVLVSIIERRIYLIRGKKVMLSNDLAELYQVEVRTLVQAIKRNVDRFPADFMFQLNQKESGRRRSHLRRPPTPPYVRFRIRRFMKSAGDGAVDPAATRVHNDQSRI